MLYNSNMTNKRTKVIYSNCGLYDAHGLLCRCSNERAQWYLKKGLATVISENPLEILLNFDPGVSKEQRELVYCIKKQNICSVCGNSNLTELTRHHIIPMCFRQLFPPEYKSYLSHDVLPVCNDCHVMYHKHANYKIEQMFDACHKTSEAKKRRKFVKDTLRLFNALRQNNIPQQRVEQIQHQLHDTWGEDDLGTIESQCLLENASPISYSKIYLEQIEDLECFILNWRLDFIDVMQPKFLPVGWSIDFHIKQELSA